MFIYLLLLLGGKPASGEGVFPARALTLAEMPFPPMTQIGSTLWVLAAIVIIAGSLLKTYNEGRKAMGRRPPMEDEVAGLRAAIADKADGGDMEKIHDQIIPRERLLADFLRIDEEIKDLRNQVKTGAAQVAEKLDNLQRQIATGFTALDEKRSRSIGNLHEHLTATKERVAAMESSLTAATQTVHLLDAKFEALRQNNLFSHAPRSR